MEELTIKSFLERFSTYKGRNLYIQNMVKIKGKGGDPYDVTTNLCHLNNVVLSEDSCYILIAGDLESNGFRGTRENSIRLRKEYIKIYEIDSQQGGLTGFMVTVEIEDFMNIIKLWVQD